MGTTQQKLDKIKQTKRRLKNNINSLGGGLTESSKFSDYPHALGELYNRLPKTTYQEGTNINLGKTLKAVVQYEDDKVMYGDTEQDSTQGYNLLDIASSLISTSNNLHYTMNTDGSFNVSGTPNQTWAYISNVINKELEAGTYTISLKNSISFRIYIAVTYADTTTANFVIDSGNTNRTFTTTQKITSYRVVGAVLSTSTTYNENVCFMLETGSTAHTFEPYTNGASPNPTYPQPIQVVTGTQEVVVRGGNSFNDSNLQNVKVSDLTNNLGLYNISLKAGTYHKFIEFTDNTQWITNITFQFKDSSNTTIITKYTNTDFTITEEEASQIAKLQLWTNDAGRTDYATKTIKGLLISQEISTYEPYITPTTYTLHLGNMEFAGIGDYVDDIVINLDDGKWYKKKAIKKKIFNGSENWTLSSGWAKPNSNCFYLANSVTSGAFYGGFQTMPPMLSNYYVVTTRDYLNSEDQNNIGFSGDVNNPNLTVRTLKSINGADKTTFETWLGTHNLIVYYALKETAQTTEEITDETLIQDLDNIYSMMSVEGTTIIEGSGNLPMNTKVRAVKGE